MVSVRNVWGTFNKLITQEIFSNELLEPTVTQQERSMDMSVSSPYRVPFASYKNFNEPQCANNMYPQYVHFVSNFM